MIPISPIRSSIQTHRKKQSVSEIEAGVPGAEARYGFGKILRSCAWL
jgi:hypothetical protein